MTTELSYMLVAWKNFRKQAAQCAGCHAAFGAAMLWDRPGQRLDVIAVKSCNSNIDPRVAQEVWTRPVGTHAKCWCSLLPQFIVSS